MRTNWRPFNRFNWYQVLFAIMLTSLAACNVVANQLVK
jgi:hypothetical protein